MKKIWEILLLLALLAACAAPGCAEIGFAEVNREGVNFRKAPGGEFIARFDAPQSVYVFEEKTVDGKRWCHVYTFVGKRTRDGWIRGDMLRFLSDEFVLDFKGLLFAAIIIGASGAAMDVAVSIASSLDELSQKAPDLSARQLFSSGVAIGRDIMGTMSNTLILAYVGGAIHLILLLYAYPVPFANIINRETVAAEILIALCGSMGILSTIPLTALIVSFLHRHTAEHPFHPGKFPE